MNKHLHQFTGRLTRMPFPDKPSKAMAQTMPIENENDFDVFANLPASDMPILLSFPEHHSILASIVEQGQKLWPEDLSILVRISMPAAMRLPATLLAPNVLLMQEIQPELNKLLQRPGKVLVVENRWVRFQIERGNNEIHLQLYSDSDDQQANFDQWLDILPQWGVEKS